MNILKKAYCRIYQAARISRYTTENIRIMDAYHRKAGFESFPIKKAFTHNTSPSTYLRKENS